VSRRPLRILLVDDDHEDAFLFQKRCRDRVAVHHVTTASHALSTLATGTFDACFVDYRLGTESGLDLVRAARARHAGLPLIVITGLQIEVLGENALLAGATDFIPKEELDGATIERTVRWALIRRHVELHREEQDHVAIVANLMGRAPSPVAASASVAGLRRVVFVSVAREVLTSAELLRMCARFAAANARLGVTGVLAYAGERFLEVVEGPEAAVEVLMRRIEADPRHARMQVVLDEPAGSRWFDEWTMGVLRSPWALARTPGPEGAGDAAARVRGLLGESMSRSGVERLLLALPRLG
jgi:DNA-binding response OmpR family regulator